MAQSSLVVQGRVIVALILRDVKARFGGRAANYLIAIGWPLSHMAILMITYTALGRPPPLGDSGPLFFATGILPFIIFQYTTRWMMQAYMLNSPLLNFRIVTFLDIILARAALEVITAFAVTLILGFVLFGCDVPVLPRHPFQAGCALLASLLFAFAIGVLFSVIFKFLKMVWFFVYIMMIIVLYMTSGILFVVEALPAMYRDILSWSPTVQMVEWFRSAYFEGYGQTTLDRSYLVTVALITLAVGLAAERLTRRLDARM